MMNGVAIAARQARCAFEEASRCHRGSVVFSDVVGDDLRCRVRDFYVGTKFSLMLHIVKLEVVISTQTPENDFQFF